MPINQRSEDQVRALIDKMLINAGWLIQDKKVKIYRLVKE